MKLALGAALGTALVVACGGSAGTGLFTGSDGGASSSSGVASGGGSSGSGGGSNGGSSSASGSGGSSSSGGASSSASSTGGSTSSTSSGGPGDAGPPPPPDAGPDGGGLGQLCDVFNADPFKVIQWKLQAQQSVQDGTAVYCEQTDACTAAECCFPLATDLAVCVTK